MDDTNNSGKAPDAFRTISEASDEIGVPPHVLRFWEGKFTHLRPLKRAGGRRFYRTQDMAILRGLKELLQTDGYTIRGVQKLIKESGIQAVRDRANSPNKISNIVTETSGEEIRLWQRAKVDEELGDDTNEMQSQNDATAAHANGIMLRRALVRLEQARMLLDKVVQV